MENLVIVSATVLLIVGVIAFGVWLWGWYVTRERGPWVVTRVAVGGGREFLDVDGNLVDWWVTNPINAFHFGSQAYAKDFAEDYLADVAPLSQFTGVK